MQSANLTRLKYPFVLMQREDTRTTLDLRHKKRVFPRADPKHSLLKSFANLLRALIAVEISTKFAVLDENFKRIRQESVLKKPLQPSNAGEPRQI